MLRLIYAVAEPCRVIMQGSCPIVIWAGSLRVRHRSAEVRGSPSRSTTVMWGFPGWIPPRALES